MKRIKQRPKKITLGSSVLINCLLVGAFWITVAGVSHKQQLISKFQAIRTELRDAIVANNKTQICSRVVQNNQFGPFSDALSSQHNKNITKNLYFKD